MKTYFKHPNGYSCKLYGKSSLSVYDGNGKKVMHTGFRNVNTEAEAMELLEGMPKFQEMLAEHWEDVFNDEEEHNV